MAKNWKYLGPFDEVEVPAIGAVVKRGETVTVEDPEISEGFDSQTDSWQHIPDKGRSEAAKKAAATRTDDSQEG